MENLAYQMDEAWDEMIDGKIVAMSPRPIVNHNIVASNIHRVFWNFLRGKPCKPFGDGVDLYLTPTDRFIPDGMIVCNKDIIKYDGIYGTPDLVVEVISPGTAKRDKGYKKNAYEKAGVKEYWIVEIESKSIEVYLLQDGRFELDNIYSILPDYLVNKMTEEERNSVPMKFKCSLFSELIITIVDVFEDVQ